MRKICNIQTGEITEVPLTQAEIDEFAARAVVEAPQITAEQAARQAAAAIRIDARIQQFGSRTPVQIRTYVANNINTLADAKDMIADLAVVVGQVVRRV